MKRTRKPDEGLESRFIQQGRALQEEVMKASLQFRQPDCNSITLQGVHNGQPVTITLTIEIIHFIADYKVTILVTHDSTGEADSELAVHFGYLLSNKQMFPQNVYAQPDGSAHFGISFAAH